jgi:hypothetical protein
MVKEFFFNSRQNLIKLDMWNLYYASISVIHHFKFIFWATLFKGLIFWVLW